MRGSCADGPHKPGFEITADTKMERLCFVRPGSYSTAHSDIDHRSILTDYSAEATALLSSKNNNVMLMSVVTGVLSNPRQLSA